MTRAKTIVCVTTVCLATLAAAAFSQPSWVKEAAREATTYSPHKDASALILHHSVDATLSANKTQLHVQKAIRVIKPDAEKFGHLVEAIAPFREVKNLKGWTLRPEGEVRVLSKEHIIQLSASGPRDDAHFLAANLPGVKAGAVVAFEYDIEEIGVTSSYQSFIFQEQQPVRFVRFSVRMPEGWALHEAEWHLQGINFKREPALYEWSGRDLAYRAEEPLMPPWQYLSRRIAIVGYDSTSQTAEHFRDWSAVAKWCVALHDPAARAEPDVAAEARRLTQNLNTTEEKLKRIAEFVRDDIRYVAVEIGKERWQPRNAAQTLYNRYGDCKDKTTLMRALLEAVNIPSVPVLANTTYAVRSSLPTPFQFNHCIIGIPTQHLPPISAMPNATTNGWLFFDPTDPTARLGDLPVVLQGDLVLLATQSDTLLQRLPYRVADNYRREFRADAALAADGAMSAKVSIIDFGDRALAARYRRNLMTREKQEEEWREFFSQTIPNVVMTHFQSGAAGDSAWVSFQVQAQNYLKTAPPFFLMKTNFFQASQPPALTSDKREHPIWFGPAEREDFRLTWTLAQEWAFEETPAAILNATPSAQLECQTQTQASTLKFYCMLQRDGRALPVEEYLLARKLSQAQSAASKATTFLKKR